MNAPLADVEVVEFCSAVAGPYAGKLLSDYGANVTRIEPVEGSLMRNRRVWYDVHEKEEFTYRFLPYNTGKDSLAVDLKSEAGKAIADDLLAEADVFVENMRPGTIDRLDFGWERVEADHPDIVYCSVSGFGQYGPYSSKPAYDPGIQGAAAWTHHIGDGDGPELMDVIAIDHATAMYAALGIMLALWERERSGSGQRLNVSMFETALSFLGHQFSEYSAAQAHDDVEPSYDRIEPLRIYEVSDGHLTLFVPPERWSSFCAAIDREQYTDDDHPFSTANGRVEHSESLHEELEALFRERTFEEWKDLFVEEAPGIVCEPVNEIGDIPEDPHVIERESVVTRDHPDMGEYTMPGKVLRFSRTPGSIGHAPGVGQQTDEILEALGYDSQEITRLRNENVVG
jgi:crotonobetainyl-CoA:carnitine CoA-transferase CaiB-like acyl-CoA transferase